MTLITPQLKLTLQRVPNEPDVYILESTATFQNENYMADGHSTVPSGLNSANVLEIELLITDGEPLNALGPSTVVHTLNLGSLDFVVDDFGIDVTLKKGGTKKGKGHIKAESVMILTK